ncbi:MAG: Lrp/AsnC family transcriptional regulator [Desulfovibrio sp.]
MIDSIDHQILQILQDDSRTSNAEIARQVGLSPAAIHGRIKRLEQSNVIEKFTVKLNPEAINMPIVAYCSVYLREMSKSEEAAAGFAAVNEVMEVHYTIGEACFLLKVRCHDTADLERVLTDINNVFPVRATNTVMVLRHGKHEINPPLYAAVTK